MAFDREHQLTLDSNAINQLAQALGRAMGQALRDNGNGKGNGGPATPRESYGSERRHDIADTPRKRRAQQALIDDLNRRADFKESTYGAHDDTTLSLRRQAGIYQANMRPTTKMSALKGALSGDLSGFGELAGGMAESGVGLAAAAALYIGGQALGIKALKAGVDNYFNPTVYSAPATGGDKGINDYINGLYATALIVNCPTVEDLKRIDDWLTWYGCPTEEIGVPMIYTEGDYYHDSKVNHIHVKNPYGFMFIKTSGAVVRCPNGQAKAQFEQMLNQGTRFWNVDADRQETAA